MPPGHKGGINELFRGQGQRQHGYQEGGVNSFPNFDGNAEYDNNGGQSNNNAIYDRRRVVDLLPPIEGEEILGNSKLDCSHRAVLTFIFEQIRV